MVRLQAALVSVVVALCAVTGLVRPLDAQVLAIRPTAALDVSLALSFDRAAPLRAEAWTRAIGTNGRLPNHERMLVVSATGQVLSVIDGDRDRVVLPSDLADVLARVALNVTLVHNHRDSVSLSGSDLVQLGKVGVARVVALGHDGTMYAASGAAEFALESAVENRYGPVLARVLERVSRESQFSGASLAGLYPHIPHVVALIFERAGVIRYAVDPSADTWATLERYRAVIERLVDAEAPRLRAELLTGAVREN